MIIVKLSAVAQENKTNFKVHAAFSYRLVYSWLKFVQVTDCRQNSNVFSRLPLARGDFGGRKSVA